MHGRLPQAQHLQHCPRRVGLQVVSQAGQMPNQEHICRCQMDGGVRPQQQVLQHEQPGLSYASIRTDTSQEDGAESR